MALLPITRQQLQNASRDADDFGKFVNDPANSSPFVTRLGTSLKTLKAVEAEILASNPYGQFRGDWTSVANYVIKDVVQYNGNLWYAETPSTNIVPIVGANWSIFMPGTTVADNTITRDKIALSLGYSIPQNIREYGAVPGSDAFAAVTAALAAVGNNAPLIIPPGAFTTASAIALGRATKMEFGSSLLGAGQVTLGRIILGTHARRADSIFGDRSKYLFLPDTIHHAFDDETATESFKKHTFGLFRYYDGKAKPSSVVRGHNLYAHGEYGFNRPATDPATGTTSLFDGALYVRQVGEVVGDIFGAASDGTMDPIVVVLSGQSNSTGVPEATEGPFYVDPLVHIYRSDSNTFPVGALGTQGYASRKTSAGGTYNYFGAGINNLGVAFAKSLADKTGRAVYLIACGEGSASISQWVGTGTTSRLYAANKADIQAALALIGRTKVDYFLWQQGEADASDTGYAAKLQTLISQLSSEPFWNPTKTFFRAGHPCPEWTDPNRTALVARIDTLNSDGNDYTGSVGTGQLTATVGNSDNNIHFSGDSLYILGYYNYLQSLTSGAQATELTPFAAAVVPIYTGDFGNQRKTQLYYDFNTYGPRASHRANREAFLAGPTVAVVKYSPGNDIGDGFKGSYGISIFTAPGTGGFDSQNKTGWRSYPLRAGIAISGWSGVVGTHVNGDSPGADSGYDAAIWIGAPGGSVWAVGASRSRISNAIIIQDYVGKGIDIRGKHPDASASAYAIEVGVGAGYTVLKDKLLLPNLVDNAGAAITYEVYRDAADGNRLKVKL